MCMFVRPPTVDNPGQFLILHYFAVSAVSGDKLADADFNVEREHIVHYLSLCLAKHLYRPDFINSLYVPLLMD